MIHGGSESKRRGVAFIREPTVLPSDYARYGLKTSVAILAQVRFGDLTSDLHTDLVGRVMQAGT